VVEVWLFTGRQKVIKSVTVPEKCYATYVMVIGQTTHLFIQRYRRDKLLVVRARQRGHVPLTLQEIWSLIQLQGTWTMTSD
jgi:hypothetical protein